ncbi:FecR domain-containing protein [Chitinophaga sp. 212800010-3]|uniref:FecR family protein n=1 Tax=unclassified Chitinophaga TaxID=2619133 RepID=UPI002DF1B885|nr:hypothetical protein [Chitinophaga sp. 212800010-3]
MTNEEFRKLGAKLLDGTATPDEEQAFLESYELLQRRYPQWDATVMGEEEAFRKSLFRDVMNRIDDVARRRRLIWFSRAAAAVLLLAALGTGTWLFLKKPRAPVLPVQTSIASGDHIKQLQLPDGTKIWLNTASNLIVPENFGNNTRELTLTGEAYFEVANSPAAPFVLHTGKLTTRVLGTSFNVKAYTEDKTIAVTVVSGKVGVTSRSGAKAEPMLVTPDQRAVYDKTNNELQREEHIGSGDMTAWKEGRLLFRNTPMNEVLNALKRRYHVNVSCSPAMEDCPVYGDFNNEPLEKVLKVLALSLRGEIVPQDDGFLIKGKRCH